MTNLDFPMPASPTIPIAWPLLISAAFAAITRQRIHLLFPAHEFCDTFRDLSLTGSTGDRRTKQFIKRFRSVFFRICLEDTEVEVVSYQVVGFAIEGNHSRGQCCPHHRAEMVVSLDIPEVYIERLGNSAHDDEVGTDPHAHGERYGTAFMSAPGPICPNMHEFREQRDTHEWCGPHKLLAPRKALGTLHRLRLS